jgi:hypothetical protein
MPNKRDPNKRVFSAWVDKDELKHFKKRAADRGMTLTQLISYALAKETSFQKEEVQPAPKAERPRKP